MAVTGQIRMYGAVFLVVSTVLASCQPTGQAPQVRDTSRTTSASSPDDDEEPSCRERAQQRLDSARDEGKSEAEASRRADAEFGRCMERRGQPNPEDESAPCENDTERKDAEPSDDPETVAVYFKCMSDAGGPDHQPLYKFDHDAGSADSVEQKLQVVLSKYLDGPSRDQEARGYRSALAVNGGSSLLNEVSVERGEDATVDLDGSLLELGVFGTASSSEQVIAELSRNTFQFDDIDRLRVGLDGSCGDFALLIEPFDIGCELDRETG